VVLRLPVSGSVIDRLQTNILSWTRFAGAAAYLVEYTLRASGFASANASEPESPVLGFPVAPGGACPDDLATLPADRFCERGDTVLFPLWPVPGVDAPRASWRVFPLDQGFSVVPGTRASDAASVSFR
jgi:hypothetical protein